MLDEGLLAAAAERHFGAGTTVSDVRRLTGGASRETWSFDAMGPDGTRRALVLRRDPGGALPGAMGRTAEYRLLETAATVGVPVPAVCFPLEEGDGLGSGFVMERVDGETIPRRILRDDAFADARSAMAGQCGTIAARIHAVDLAELADVALDGPAPGEHPAVAQIRQYRELLDAFGEPHPAFELGLRWLEEHLPPLDQVRLVHGDFRNGNFVVGSDGIRAVLDWELAHLGDPMEDLGWLCVRAWRFRSPLPVGGFGDRHDLFAAYEAAGGGAVDTERVHYWEVFGTLKWGVMCIVQAFTHLHGLHRSVELAAIGRRVAEQEYDLLRLIG
ncbi:MAG TPA: phosphotransferase family protein [Acidimicrobiia bacterium]|nr:phosphotransferase family protein [Acidimicrobiia bacterium]